MGNLLIYSAARHGGGRVDVDGDLCNRRVHKALKRALSPARETGPGGEGPPGRAAPFSFSDSGLVCRTRWLRFFLSGCAAR
jgi:hypothetical protein